MGIENGTGVAVEAGWVPKAEAAQRVGLSVRSLERIAAKGYVEVRLLGRDRGRGKLAVYSEVDLAAWKAGSPNQHAIPVAAAGPSEAAPPVGAPATSTALELVRSPKKGDEAGAVALYLARLAAGAQQQAAPAPTKPWLTAAEAAEFSGLPEAFLRKRAAEGVTWAVNVGGGSSARWRFNRDALGGSGL
jgi:hypothetical protein